MLVKCIKNIINSEIKETDYDGAIGYEIGSNIPLKLNKCYVVYGFNDIGNKWICINDEEKKYPVWYPLSFFTVMDSRKSKFWKRKKDSYIFEEWHVEIEGLSEEEYYNRIVIGNESESYYMSIVDGNDESVKNFESYKQKCDLEFKNCDEHPRITVLDEDWVQCLNCAEVWKVCASNELAKCPACLGVFELTKI